ncbi:chaperonin [Nymphon striatum]|nr:chaperonin [Nymphon striatum]
MAIGNAVLDVVLEEGFMDEPLDVRGRAVHLGPMLDTILKRHEYPQDIAFLMGEMISLAVLLGTSLKFEGNFILQTQSDGPVSLAVAMILIEEARIKSLQQQLALAQSDWTRISELQKRGSATPRSVEERELIVSQRSQSLEQSQLNLVAEKSRIEQLKRAAIDKISFVGMRDEELQVEISERELRRLGLSIAEISAVIAGNSRDTPSGQLKGDVEKQIRALADAEDPTALNNIEIKSFATGEKVLLGDIAVIKRGYEDGQARGLSGGKSAIQITVERALSADTLKTARILDQYLSEIEDVMPAGVTLKKYEVRADSLVERISLLFWNGIFGLVLVVATLFIFLNARIAFWVAAGISGCHVCHIGLSCFCWGKPST